MTSNQTFSTVDSMFCKVPYKYPEPWYLDPDNYVTLAHERLITIELNNRSSLPSTSRTYIQTRQFVGGCTAERTQFQRTSTFSFKGRGICKGNNIHISMSQQKVFRLPSKGAGYNALKEGSEPVPKPAAHEVVLQIHAATLNYRDLVIANGGYPFPVKDDVVPLSDGAGTIVEVGSGVKSIEKGDWGMLIYILTCLRERQSIANLPS